MNDFGVLTNRRRALIALIHSLVFLGIAMHGFASPKKGILHESAVVADFILLAIYQIVAAVLGWLVTISRCTRERMYFAFCASSAAFGLVRVCFGDAAVPAAQYLRVAMLSSAVAFGIVIVRSFSRPAPERAISE